MGAGKQQPQAQSARCRLLSPPPSLPTQGGPGAGGALTRCAAHSPLHGEPRIQRWSNLASTGPHSPAWQGWGRGLETPNFCLNIFEEDFRGHFLCTGIREGGNGPATLPAWGFLISVPTHRSPPPRLTSSLRMPDTRLAVAWKLSTFPLPEAPWAGPAQAQAATLMTTSTDATAWALTLAREGLC